MVNLDYVRKSGDIAELKEIPFDNIKLLWKNNCYDGRPLEGIMEYKGKMHFFLFLDHNRDDYASAGNYAVIELTNQQKQEEEKWRNLFREKVGTHTDFGETGKKRGGNLVKPQRMHREFYEPYEKEQAGKNKFESYCRNEVIGFFRM